MEDKWKYRAQLLEVVDGDTMDLNLDLGFKTYKRVRIRLNGVDTAEIYGSEKGSDEYGLGMEQKRFVEDALDVDSDKEWPLRFVSTEEDGKFGRWIGDIQITEDETLISLLKQEYDGDQL